MHQSLVERKLHWAFANDGKNSSKRWIVHKVTFCKYTFKEYLKQSQSILQTKNNTETEFGIVKSNLSIAIALKLNLRDSTICASQV